MWQSKKISILEVLLLYFYLPDSVSRIIFYHKPQPNVFNRFIQLIYLEPKKSHYIKLLTFSPSSRNNHTQTLNMLQISMLLNNIIDNNKEQNKIAPIKFQPNIFLTICFGISFYWIKHFLLFVITFRYNWFYFYTSHV